MRNSLRGRSQPPVAYNHISKIDRIRDPTQVPTKVVVGEGEASQDFYFHQGRLAYHSDFCDAALSSRWREGQEHTIRLPEDDPALFATFSKFVYTGGIHCGQVDDKRFEQGKKLEDDALGARLIALWALGDKLMSPTFRDAVVNRLTDELDCNGYYPVDFHQVVYAMTSGACGLRRLAVDVAFQLWPEGALAEAEMDESWNEFFRDAAVRAWGEDAGGPSVQGSGVRLS